MALTQPPLISINLESWMKQVQIVLKMVLSLTILLSACSVPAGSSTATPVLSAENTAEIPPPDTPGARLGGQVQAEHRIAVRVVDGAAEFYDVRTAEKFTPRGANYVFVPAGNSYILPLLRVGTYNPARTRADFSHLASLGYNTVRVFLDHCNSGSGCIANTTAPGLDPAYLDNIADMMLAARETGIFIQFTSNDLPDDGGYADEANEGSGGDFAGYRNSYYLRPQAISATRRYWRDILTGLVERDAAFDAVLGWQLLNEQWMFLDQPPLSLSAGLVETTTGIYDMSDPSQKKQMVSEGLVFYIAQMKEEILAHDPTALVTMGFFAPELAAPGWYVETASLLEKSDLDYFDFHAYPGWLDLEAYAEAFGMLGYSEKPVVLGEYGAFRHVYADLDTAARVTTNWVADSCRFGFDGWLYWTYYPADAGADDRTWGLTDEGEYLLTLFSPAEQPDPCIPIEIPNANLAFNKPTRASASLPEEPASLAVDDNLATQWGAGDSPVQWIEVDLEGSYRITEIELVVAQWPEGDSRHLIQVRASSAEDFRTVHEFQGFTRENDRLSFAPDLPLENVGEIRIQTLSSPSWVAWKEIQVFGEAVGP
jgi:hypothetical protein